MFNDHLKAVQRVLQEWGEPEPICRAGLLHSIYGTQGDTLFQTVLIKTGI